MILPFKFSISYLKFNIVINAILIGEPSLMATFPLFCWLTFIDCSNKCSCGASACFAGFFGFSSSFTPVWKCHHQHQHHDHHHRRRRRRRPRPRHRHRHHHGIPTIFCERKIYSRDSNQVIPHEITRSVPNLYFRIQTHPTKQKYGFAPHHWVPLKHFSCRKASTTRTS